MCVSLFLCVCVVYTLTHIYIDHTLMHIYTYKPYALPNHLHMSHLPPLQQYFLAPPLLEIALLITRIKFQKQLNYT